MKTEITKKLEDIAVRWLFIKKCHAIIKEAGLCYDGGIADVLGIKKDGTIYYLEVKQSRSDLMSRKQKYHNRRFENFDGQHPYDFTYFVIPDSGLEIKDNEYPDWGIIKATNLSVGIKFPINSINPEATIIRKAKRRKTKKNLEDIWKYFARSATLRAYREVIYL